MTKPPATEKAPACDRCGEVHKIVLFSNLDGVPGGPPKAIQEAVAKHMQRFVRAPEYDQDGAPAYMLEHLP